MIKNPAYWCITNAKGVPMPWTLGVTKKDSIFMFETGAGIFSKNSGPTFSFWKKQGCRLIKVTLVEVEQKNA